jgi:hypothetical protein
MRDSSLHHSFASSGIISLLMALIDFIDPNDFFCLPRPQEEQKKSICLPLGFGASKLIFSAD